MGADGGFVGKSLERISSELPKISLGKRQGRGILEFRVNSIDDTFTVVVVPN